MAFERRATGHTRRGPWKTRGLFHLEATARSEPAHQCFAGLGCPRSIPSFTFATISTKGHMSWAVVHRQVPYSSSRPSVNRHILTSWRAFCSVLSQHANPGQEHSSQGNQPRARPGIVFCRISSVTSGVWPSASWVPFPLNRIALAFPDCVLTQCDHWLSLSQVGLGVFDLVKQTPTLRL